jgi:hypothetical protein
MSFLAKTQAHIPRHHRRIEHSTVEIPAGSSGRIGLRIIRIAAYEDCGWAWIFAWLCP